jgi:hypothetical protein
MHSGWLLFQVRRLVFVAAIVTLGAWLAGRHDRLTVIAVTAAASLLAGCGGAVLLRYSAVGRITWRNRVASWLLPFASALGDRQLPGMVLASTVLLTLLVAIGTCCQGNGWLAAGCVLDGLAAVHAVRLLREPCAPAQARTLTVLLAVAVGLASAGLVLAELGHGSLAILVAGGPPATVAVGYGAWILLLLSAGRNQRWN